MNRDSLTAPFVHLRAGGVSVVVDVRDARPPAVVHWGADLGDLGPDDLAALALVTEEPLVVNAPDAPVRLEVVPASGAPWYGAPGLSGSREGRAWSPHWRLAGVRGGEAGAPRPGGETVVFDLVDDEVALALAIELRLDAGGLLGVRATLTNDGDAPYQVDDLVVALPVPRRAGEVLDFSGAGTHERTAQRHAMTDGRWVREGRRGRTGADAATVLHLGTPGFSFSEGEVWAVHTGWSGNHRHYAERVWTGHQLLGGGEVLLPGEVRLAPGEAYAGPWLHASWGRGLDEVAARFHAFWRARPGRPERPRPVTLNCWEAVYFDHSLERLVALADAAARVGAERFVLDDGWFRVHQHERASLGDWVVAPSVWPDGLGPLVDHVRGLGMEFGLWIEPEMVNEDSDIGRAHPEWIMRTGDRLPPTHRHQQALNLGIPECYAFVRDRLVALLDEYDIAYLKWDMNRDLVDAGTMTRGGIPGVHAQTLAAYRLMAELKAHQPGLEIESCASGGGRVDLGVMELCDRIWVSDNIDPHERQRIHFWTTQLLPWEALGTHVASPVNKVTGRTSTLDFRALTAVFGHLGIEWDIVACDEEELDALARWVAWHKERRELFHTGTIVRELPIAGVHAHGVVAPDRSRAVFSCAVLDRIDSSHAGRLPLRGLDPTARYRVRRVAAEHPFGHRVTTPWWDAEVVLPGLALAEVGVQLPALQPDTAVLWEVERVG